MNKLHLEVLEENLEKLNLSVNWLQLSYNKAKAIKLNAPYTNDDFDTLEVLSSRFARTTDMLVNKVLRSIDTLESEDIGTIIDIMNRAEKRKVVESAKLLHTIKDLRNSIVHEYQIEKIAALFKDIVHLSPSLLGIVENINNYCSKYFNEQGKKD